MKMALAVLIGATVGGIVGLYGATAIAGTLGGNGQAVMAGIFIGIPLGIPLGAVSPRHIVHRVRRRKTPC
jgi:hypothetical protein